MAAAPINTHLGIHIPGYYFSGFVDGSCFTGNKTMGCLR
jgi:hypothetical protein